MCHRVYIGLRCCVSNTCTGAVWLSVAYAMAEVGGDSLFLRVCWCLLSVNLSSMLSRKATVKLFLHRWSLVTTSSSTTQRECASAHTDSDFMHPKCAKAGPVRSEDVACKYPTKYLAIHSLLEDKL